MTRINSAIPVYCLTDEHLLAEHREIKRLPYCLNSSIRSGSIGKIPKSFKLGPGHILFFLNKMQFISKRYNEVYEECQRRGFDVTSYHDNFNAIPCEYFNPYQPTTDERKLLIERISTRLINSSKKHWHYCGKKITSHEAVEILVKEEK